MMSKIVSTSTSSGFKRKADVPPPSMPPPPKMASGWLKFSDDEDDEDDIEVVDVTPPKRDLLEEDWICFDPEAAAADLLKEGVVVIPCLSDRKRVEVIGDLERCLKTSPGMPAFFVTGGFASLNKDRRLACGGFGALNSVPGFYNEISRDLVDELADHHLVEFYRALSRMTGAGWVRHNPDRLLVRSPGTNPTAESFHQDFAPDRTEYQFGGWLSLKEDQKFSYMAESQLREHRFYSTYDENVAGRKDGFTRNRDKINKIFYDQFHRVIDIPVGSLILFFSHILHEIKPSKLKTTMIRQFFNVNFSTDPRTISPVFVREQRMRLINQVPPKLPSGQEPREVPKMYWPIQRNLLVKLSEQYPNYMCEMWSVKDRNSPLWGQQFRGLKQFPGPFTDKDGNPINCFRRATEDELKRVGYVAVV